MHSRDPRQSPCRDPSALLACASLPCCRDCAGLGRWARKSRFSGASLPNFVSCHPCVLAPCSSLLPTFFFLLPSSLLDFLGPSALLVSSPRSPATLPYCSLLPGTPFRDPPRLFSHPVFCPPQTPPPPFLLLSQSSCHPS